MTDQLTAAQKELATYLFTNNFTNLSDDKVQTLISGMTAQAITEALEEARKQITQLKSTGLGRELL